MGLYKLSYNLRMFKIENLPEMGYFKRIQLVNVKKATFQKKEYHQTNVHGLQYETYQMSAWIKWIKLDNGLYSLAFSLSKTTVFVTCIKWFCALNCGTLITVSIDNDLPF